jgi:hypothetical protein
MQIILNQDDISSAITTYLQTQGLNLEGKTVEVQFTATRKPAGYSAMVDVIGGLQAPRSTVKADDDDEVVDDDAEPEPGGNTEEATDTPAEEATPEAKFFDKVAATPETVAPASAEAPPTTRKIFG